ncbi:MAG: DUF4214 domain-containing protein [Desulfobulbaceae bacterium]|nr:DUF4214 domain-containing protein [Desulfobulbaceae bacterium]
MITDNKRYTPADYTEKTGSFSVPKSHTENGTKTMNRRYFSFLRFFLFFFFSLGVTCSISHAASVSFSWSPNSEANLQGYKIYYGTASGNYTLSKDVGNPQPSGGIVGSTLSGFTEGVTYYFAAVAYDTDGFESDFSDEVLWTCPVTVAAAPPAATAPPTTTSADDSTTTMLVSIGTATTLQEEEEIEDTVAVESADQGQTNDSAITKVEDFVIRFYEQCLYRSPDIEGLQNWVDALLTERISGSDLAENFVFSQEFTNLNTSNEEYVTILYKAFFDREPDDAGFNSWISALDGGMNRGDVLSGFTESVEFKTLCNKYEIMSARQENTQSSSVEQFVTRFYERCLLRSPDQTGLNNWVSGLVNGSYTGADVARSFILSQEFSNANTSDDEYLTILYRAFFGREPDEAGYNSWASALNSGRSRTEVLDNFINSAEFINLCNQYGISNI